MCRSLLVIVPDFPSHVAAGRTASASQASDCSTILQRSPTRAIFEPPTDHYQRAQAWLVLIHLWNRRVVLGSLSFMPSATRRSRGGKLHLGGPPMARFTKVWAGTLNVGPNGWCRLGSWCEIGNRGRLLAGRFVLSRYGIDSLGRGRTDLKYPWRD